MTPMQQRLYEYMMLVSGSQDLSITTMFTIVYPDATMVRGLAVRDMQQKLGPLISRINKHIRANRERIEPGKLKNTYRLTTDYRG